MQIRRTKIIATLGPATDSPEVLRALIEAGADILRINLSHGTHEGQAKRAKQSGMVRSSWKPVMFLRWMLRLNRLPVISPG